MDIPIHLAAAACAGQWLYGVYGVHPVRSASNVRLIGCGLSAFGLGVASHLLLDAIPHYTFIYGILRLSDWPAIIRYGWIALKIGLLSLPVFISVLVCTRRQAAVVLTALCGGLYPDIEKYLYISGILPRWLVFFPWHSYAYSPDNAWEASYKPLLILAEIGLYGLLLWGLAAMARYRLSQQWLQPWKCLIFDRGVLKFILAYAAKQHHDPTSSDSEIKISHS
jgi:hypothetical protein